MNKEEEKIFIHKFMEHFIVLTKWISQNDNTTEYLSHLENLQEILEHKIDSIKHVIAIKQNIETIKTKI